MKREEKELKLQLKKAESKNDFSKQLELCNELGNLCRAYGNIEDAKEYYEKGVQISELIHADFDGSYSHRALCEIFAEEGVRDYALSHAEAFRRLAQLSGNHSQIQLSLHVTGWVFEKLWVEQSGDPEDLRQALSWCEKSIQYIKQHGHKIDGDSASVKSGGNAARRKAGLERLCSGIAANLGQRQNAEKYWRSAYSYADRSSDNELKYDLVLSRMDFVWECPVAMAGKLCNIATPKKKGPALMELGQALMYAGDMIGAQSKLLECLAKYKSSLTIADSELLEARIIFLYEYLYRLRKAEDKETPRKMRRKMYEKIADSLCDYTRERKDLLKMALRFYEKMYCESISDKEKHPALVSLAETAADMGDYSIALDYYEKVLILEQNMNFTQAKTTETKVALFIVQCRGKLLSKTELLNQFDYLNTLLPEEKTSLKANMYRELGKYMSLNEERIGEDYEKKANELEEKVENEQEEDNATDEENSNEDELDTMDSAAILRECLNIAKAQNSDREIEEDRDKVKNSHGETRMHIVARTTDIALLEKLISKGYNVNMRDYGGWTPLSEAVSAGVRDNVRLLLRNKAHVDCVSREKLESDENSTGGGITPLMEACDKGLIDIARDLLKFGASVVRRNQDGWTAVDFLRNMILDLDDEVEIKEAEKLAEDMEEMQRKLSFAVRSSLPPKRQIQMEGTATRKVPAQKSRSVSPGIQNLNAYKRVISRLGGQTTIYDKASEVGLFDDDPDNNVRDQRRMDNHLDEDYLEDLILEAEPSFTDKKEKRRQSNESTTSCSSRISSEYQFNHREDILSTSINQWRTVSHIQNTSIESESVGDRNRKRKHDVRNEEYRKRRPIERSSKSRNSSPVLAPHQTSLNNRSPLPEIKICRRSQRHDATSDPPILNTASNSIISTTSSSTNLLITLKFQNEMGEPLRVDKLVAFPRISTMSAVFARFKDELLPHQQSFDVLLADGREVDIDIPLESLPDLKEIICRLKKATAEIHYRNSGGVIFDDVLSALRRFDISGSFDVSSIELNNHGLTGVVLSAVSASNKDVQEIVVDYCELDNNAITWISENIKSASKFSAKSCGLVDDQLDVISKATSIHTNLNILDLSHSELLSASVLAGFLTHCPNLKNLRLSGLDLTDGFSELNIAIAGLTNLEALDLSYSSWLRANSVEFILNRCEKISQLILSGCNLDSITFSSTWLPHLRHLSLVGCQMQNWDSLLEWMSLGCVECLDLSCTSFSLSDLNTLITSRLKCPPMIVRLAQCQHLESDPRSLLDLILPQIGSHFSLRFSFSSHFVTTIRALTAYSCDFLAQ